MLSFAHKACLMTVNILLVCTRTHIVEVTQQQHQLVLMGRSIPGAVVAMCAAILQEAIPEVPVLLSCCITAASVCLHIIQPCHMMIVSQQL